ncbi:MAG: alpha amylase N-terminal ig-like domain-containing protein [Treponema sp.]
MNFSAVVHNCCDNYSYPLNDHELAVSIKTGRDIQQVFVLYGDPFDGFVTDKGWKWAGKRMLLTEIKPLAHHVWHTGIIPLAFGRCKYYFELHSTYSESDAVLHEEIAYLLEDGFYTPAEISTITGVINAFNFPWLNEKDCLHIPDWIDKTVWYQIFPDRFCRYAQQQRETELSGLVFKTWANADTPVQNNEYYGGNIAGIISKLDYLADLGINGLYLNPLNASPSVHKYDTSDYFTIDPTFGTQLELKTLVQEAHHRGIKIMLDGVFNHCGWNFAPWQDVIRKGAASHYWNWFIVSHFPIETKEAFNTDGAVLLPSGENGKKGRYKTFAYIDYMPKLNTNNPDVIEYLVSVCEHWVQTFAIDGIRLDVANELSHTFCRKLRERLLAIKPDFYIMGEIWHNAMPWLRGGELDAVMNYPLASALWKFASDTAQTADTLEYAVNTVLTQYPVPLHAAQFNLLDSHDTIRLITRNKGNEHTLWQQYALLFALPGSPCIYYGSEVLLAGGEDPDNRRCMPWAGIEAGIYDQHITTMKGLIALRRTHPAMKALNYRFVHTIQDSKKDMALRVVHLQKCCGRDNFWRRGSSSNEEALGQPAGSGTLPYEAVLCSSIPCGQPTANRCTKSSIELILNFGTAPVSLTAVLQESTYIYLAHQYDTMYLQPGGFIFFESPV